MREGPGLGFGEFLGDLRQVITSPARRFAVIHDRGALWGSLLLLIAPAYFAFSFAGGVYFDEDPFPGYSFLLPALAGALLALLKVSFIHIFARLFEGRRFLSSGGKLRDLLVVFGYTSIPAVFAVLLAFSAFLIIPEKVGIFFQDFRTLGISILIAIGAVLFIWNLVLMVLALRKVYVMRDIKIVAALLLGSLTSAIPALATAAVVPRVKVEVRYLRPLFNERFISVFAGDLSSPLSGDTKIEVHLDALTFDVRSPRRFDVAAYAPTESSSTAIGIFRHPEAALGRIVALPLDRVEMTAGVIRINGQAWNELYIPEEFRSAATFRELSLGPDEFLILPEDRSLMESDNPPPIIRRDRIMGRGIINRWPFGWWLFRDTVFQQPQPAPANSSSP